jgi:aminodeoxyfutalosine synthase
MHSRKVYFTNYLNLNPTNVCTVGCLFCSFAKIPGEVGGYTRSHEEMRDRLQEAVEKFNVREVHIVGGLNDALPLEYYFDIVNLAKEIKKDIFVKAYTAVEIDYFSKRGGMTYRQVLEELKSRGLDLLPGGGAEIFAERVRRKICVKKMGTDEWFQVHRTAHELGIHSNCTMLYGHIENEEDRVDHLLRLRALEDETGGFNTFIPLAFHEKDNPLGRLVKNPADGFTDLKIYAISRLLLDNIPHLKGYWTTIGVKLAQVTLSFGVDDLGGTAYDERIIHDAGAETPVDLSREELIHLIRESGYEPCEVVSSYDHIFTAN